MKNKKIFGLLAVLVLVAVVPLTVYLSQKNQDVRQQAASVGTVPIYNLSMKVDGNYHFYTANGNETKRLTLDQNPVTWVDGGAAWHAYTSQVAGSVPIYERYLEATTPGNYGVHLYSQNQEEVPMPPWQDAGIAFYAFPSQVSGTVPVYHLYFPGNTPGIHFYTINEREKDGLTAAGVGWQDAGVVFYAYASAQNPDSMQPIPTPQVPSVTLPIEPTLTMTPAPLTGTPVPLTITPEPTDIPTPIIYEPADINTDGLINILDFNTWRDEFKQLITTKTADINKDGTIDLLDFNIWRTSFFAQ